jgi:uncharacterized protein (TIGR02246 family)
MVAYYIIILGIWVTLMTSLTTHASSAELPDVQNRLVTACAVKRHQPEEAKFMKPEEIRSLIQKAGDAWMAGDADGWAALFIPDGEFIVPGNRWVGQEEIRKAASDFASNYTVKINIRRIIIEGNQAVVEWHWQDTEKATGRLSQADDAIVVDFQAGQISRWREYIDTKTPAR